MRCWIYRKQMRGMCIAATVLMFAVAAHGQDHPPTTTSHAARMTPAVRVFRVPGHTWGQQAGLIDGADGNTLVFPADLLPTRHHLGAALDPQHAIAGVRQRDRQREPDIAEADDGHVLMHSASSPPLPGGAHHGAAPRPARARPEGRACARARS